MNKTLMHVINSFATPDNLDSRHKHGKQGFMFCVAESLVALYLLKPLLLEVSLNASRW